MKKSGGTKPRFRFGLLPRSALRAAAIRVFPFPRSWTLIALIAVLVAILIVPYFSAIAGFGVDDDSLFVLTFNVFMAFWLLGWSVAVAALALFLALLLFGREIVVVKPESLMVRIEIVPFGVGLELLADHIGALRYEFPVTRPGGSWRQGHIAFEYAGETVEFGSQLDERTGAEVLEWVRRTLRPGQSRRATTVPQPDSPAPDHQSGKSQSGAGPEPIAALLAANLVPLIGVVLFQWSLGEVMVLYWMESGIIGCYNLLKMGVIDKFGAWFAGPVFVGHYGAFMAIHFLFIFALFVKSPDPGVTLATRSEALHYLVNLWPAVLALFASHGISFRQNFLRGREFAGRTLRDQMAEPYRRIIVMQVVILAGGFLVLALDTVLPALILLIGLKTAADLRAHRREHAGTGGGAPHELHSD